MCFEKNNMKTPCLGTFPSRKQSLRKPLPLCKIACVSTGNADAPPTVMHHAGIHIDVTHVFHN